MEALSIAPGVPVLDTGTLLNLLPGHGRCGSFGLTLWPTCSEGVVQWRPDGCRRDAPAAGSWDLEGCSVRRSRTTIRRFCVHNGLGHMVSLTFRIEPGSVDGVRHEVKRFLRRLRDGIGVFPYVWVIERGEVGGRLHVHLAVSWWAQLSAVEVCEVCAVTGRRVLGDLAAAGSFCVGCIWGNGFVGRPDHRDPVTNALYVSKYVGKALDKGELRWRYYVPTRVPEFRPVVVRGRARRLEDGLEVAVACVGADAVVTPLHDVVDEWEAPPTWVIGRSWEREEVE